MILALTAFAVPFSVAAPPTALPRDEAPTLLLRSADWSHWYSIPFDVPLPRGAARGVGLCGERWSLDLEALAEWEIPAAEADELRLSGLSGAQVPCVDPLLERRARACPAARLANFEGDATLLEALALQVGMPRVVRALDKMAGAPGCERPLAAWLPALAREHGTVLTGGVSPGPPAPTESVAPSPSDGGARGRVSSSEPEESGSWARLEAIARLERLLVQTFQWDPVPPEFPETVLRLAGLYADDARALALEAQRIQLEALDECMETPGCEQDGLIPDLGAALTRLRAARRLQTSFLAAWPDHARHPEARLVYASLLFEEGDLLELAARPEDAAREKALGAGVLRAFVRDHPLSEAMPATLHRLAMWHWGQSRGSPGTPDDHLAAARRYLALASSWPASDASLDAASELARLLRMAGRDHEAIALLVGVIARARQVLGYSVQIGRPDPLGELLEELIRCWAETVRLDEALSYLAEYPDPEAAFSLHLRLAGELERRYAGREASGDAALAVYDAISTRFPTHSLLPLAMGSRIRLELDLARYDAGVAAAEPLAALVREGSAWRAANTTRHCERPDGELTTCLDEASRVLRETVLGGVDRLVKRAEERGTSAEGRILHFQRAARLFDVFLTVHPAEGVPIERRTTYARVLREAGRFEEASEQFALAISARRERGEPVEASLISGAYEATARWLDAERRARPELTHGALSDAERALVEITPVYLAAVSADLGAQAARSTALVLQERGHHRASLSLLEQALQLDPASGMAVETVCDLLAGLDATEDWALAGEVLGRLEPLRPSVDPVVAEILQTGLERARYLAVEDRRGESCALDYAAALEAFADVHPDSPLAARAFQGAADAAHAGGEPALAVTFRRRALGALEDGRLPSQASDLGRVCKGRAEAARLHTDGSEASYMPDRSELRRLLAQDLELSLRWEEAAAAWRDAAVAAPSAPWAPEAMARSAELFWALEDAREAERSLAQILVLWPRAPHALWSAVVLERPGAIRAALRHLAGQEAPDQRLAEATLRAMLEEAAEAERRFLLAHRPEDPDAVKEDFREIVAAFSSAVQAYTAIEYADVGGVGLGLRLEALVRKATLSWRLADDLLGAPTPADMDTPDLRALYQSGVQDEANELRLRARSEILEARQIAAKWGVYPPILEAPTVPDDLTALSLPPLRELLTGMERTDPRGPMYSLDFLAMTRAEIERPATHASLEATPATGCPGPRAPELLDRLAFAMLSRREPTLARRVIEARFMGWTERPPHSMAIAVTAEAEEGNGALAAADLVSARELAPDDPRLAMLEARLAIGARDLEKASDLLRALSREAPELELGLLDDALAWAELKARQVARASERLEDVQRDAGRELAMKARARGQEMLSRVARCTGQEASLLAEALVDALEGKDQALLEEVVQAIVAMIEAGRC